MKRRNCNTLVEEATDEVRNELEKLIELQNREYYDLYDKIAKNLPKKDQLEILNLNRQFVPKTKPEVCIDDHYSKFNIFYCLQL